MLESKRIKIIQKNSGVHCGTIEFYGKLLAAVAVKFERKSGNYFCRKSVETYAIFKSDDYGMYVTMKKTKWVGDENSFDSEDLFCLAFDSFSQALQSFESVQSEINIVEALYMKCKERGVFNENPQLIN